MNGRRETTRAVRDRTKRASSEDPAAVSDEWYRIALASLADAVLGTDLNDRVVFMNAAAEKLTAWTEREARGKHLDQVFKLVRPGSRTPLNDSLSRVIASGDQQAYSDDALLIARDSTERAIDFSVSAVRGQRDEVKGAVVSFSEIAKHPSEIASREALASIVEHSDDAIIGQDLSGLVTSWNGGAERIFGYKAQEMMGQRLTRLLPPERQHKEAELLGRIRRGEKVDHFHAKSVTKDGRTIDVSVTVSRTRGSRGETAGTSIIARDITEQKNSEEALKAADYNKDQFLAMLSHELRNPLAPISTALELMGLTGPMNEDQEEAREIIRRQLGRLTKLVDDLVDASRVSRGNVNFRPEVLDLSNLLDEAVRGAQSAVQARRHRLTTSIARETFRVRADALRLRQVFTNLISYAAKYTPEGGRISVQLERAGEQAVVRIRDSGSGIDPQLLERVFDASAENDDSSWSSAETGLGIGLALVRRIVQLHAGEVTASSEGASGRASEFMVRLPLVEETSAASSQQTDIRKNEYMAPLKVLIVDDNEDAASSLGMLLQLEGHQTRIEHDGGHALAATSEWTPNVVLLDIGLPDMNGYEVGEKLRRNNYEGTLIAVTGYGQEADRTRSSDAGFDAHLVKPVEIETLKRAIVRQAAR